MATRGTVRVIAISAVLAISVGCSNTTDSEPTGPSSSAPGGAGEATARPAEVWSLADARVDRIPDSPTRADSRLPRTFPAGDAAFVSLRENPPGRALVAYHPPEDFDPSGWASETIHFYGADRAWRTLNLAELRLPEQDHPGYDTYGSGDLSPDGTQWAGRTISGLVLIDLRTIQVWTVELPGYYTSDVAWSPDGATLGVSRLSGSSTSRTWLINSSTLVSQPAAYRLPNDGYGADGSVVTFAGSDGQTTRTVRGRGAAQTRTLPVPFKFVRLGGTIGSTQSVFAQPRELLVLNNETANPVARLRLRPYDSVGSPRWWSTDDELWFPENGRGLLTWDTTTGTVETLIAASPTDESDRYWTASVAVDGMP